MSPFAKAKAEAFLREWERLLCKAAPDQGGKLTVGYGHVVCPGDATTVTPLRALLTLRDDIDATDAATDHDGIGYLNDNQQAALLCFCFNVGPHAFNTSTLRACLMVRDVDAIAAEWYRWRYVHINGEPVESR